MSRETIPLAKHIDLAKMQFPAWVSEKLDGVPVRFYIQNLNGNWMVCPVSRQGEYMMSCQDAANRFLALNIERFNPMFHYTFVFEVTHRDFKGFKDVNGVVRRKETGEGLVFNLFDFDRWKIYDDVQNSGVPFGDRMSACMKWFLMPDGFQTIHQMLYPDEESLQDMLDNTPLGKDQEGWIIRSHSALWKPGTRHWDYQKVVKEPTIDLWITSAEEGVGKFSGGVGRFIASYKGKSIGIGPGKQTTAERIAALHGTYPRMACIKYKPDDGYEALRQPTFQHWRDDKVTPDA